MQIKPETKWLLGLSIGTVAALYFLGSMLTPFIIGFIIAYLGDPLVNLLQRVKISRTVAATLVFLFIFILIIGILILLIPLLQKELSQLLDLVPGIINWLQDTLTPWLGSLGIQDELNLDNLKKTVAENLPQAGGAVLTLWKTVSYSGLLVINQIISVLLVIVVTFYLLRDWDELLENLQTVIPPASRARVLSFMTECNQVLGAFFRGQFLVIICLSVIYSFGLWLAGLQTALILGILSGIINILPYLGFAIGIVFASIAMLLQYHDFIHVVYVFLVFGIGKTIDDAILTPNLIGDRIGLHPVAVIFAIIAGGHLFGVVGILLALPVVSILMVVFRHLHNHFVGVRG